jgi:hypothetical protein
VIAATAIQLMWLTPSYLFALCLLLAVAGSLGGFIWHRACSGSHRKCNENGGASCDYFAKVFFPV